MGRKPKQHQMNDFERDVLQKLEDHLYIALPIAGLRGEMYKVWQGVYHAAPDSNGVNKPVIILLLDFKPIVRLL